jgi:hypothetical protein
MTQVTMILNHLIAGGSLTPLESLSLYGVMALSQRIGELKRQGYPIRSTLVETPTHKHVSRYEWDWDAERIPYG